MPPPPHDTTLVKGLFVKANFEVTMPSMLKLLFQHWTNIFLETENKEQLFSDFFCITCIYKTFAFPAI